MQIIPINDPSPSGGHLYIPAITVSNPLIVLTRNSVKRIRMSGQMLRLSSRTVSSDAGIITPVKGMASRFVSRK